MSGQTEFWYIDSGLPISSYELNQQYQDMLDESYEDVQIAGLTYSTSVALARVDPVAYECGFAEWVDSLIGETITEDEPEA